MRTETERFGEDRLVVAQVDCDGDVCIEINDRSEWVYIYISKQQAAQFAQQILEMCGEDEGEQSE